MDEREKVLREICSHLSACEDESAMAAHAGVAIYGLYQLNPVAGAGADYEGDDPVSIVAAEMLSLLREQMWGDVRSMVRRLDQFIAQAKGWLKAEGHRHGQQ